VWLQCNIERKKEMRLAKARKSAPQHEQNLTLAELQAAGAHVQRTLDGLVATHAASGRLKLADARRFQRCACMRVALLAWERVHGVRLTLWLRVR
jgi:hypothetical protein